MAPDTWHVYFMCPTHAFHVSDICFSFWYSTVCHIYATLVLDDINRHVLHQNGVEFCQEFNGHGPRHVTRVFHVSDTWFFILVQYSVPYFCKFLFMVLDNINGHVLHQNGVEFHQEFNGHGPRHMTCVFHVSNTLCHNFANCQALVPNSLVPNRPIQGTGADNKILCQT